MRYTCHSEFLPLASVYIKSVTEAFIDEEKLNAEWEGLNYINKPVFSEAKIEYTYFETILKNETIDIKYFPKDKQLSLDSMYCRDASIATDFGIIICSMGKAERGLEPKAQSKVFL